MTIPVQGYAASKAAAPLAPFRFERRELTDNDVLIDILFCGVCHSDIHSARGEWGEATYPMVPGHEIVGRVNRVGKRVRRFKAGDFAGVGCFVDSCRECIDCKKSLEQCCQKGATFTYNSMEKDGKSSTHGGYSTQIVVDEKYTLRIGAGLPLERIAPLLCAGITTYSPLRQWGVSKGHRIGILGLGGLGHMGVKLAVSLGADVTVLSGSKSKEADAKKLGAPHFAFTGDKEVMASLTGQLDFILDTVSGPHDLNAYLQLLKTDGTLILVGAPPEAIPVQAFSLVMKRRRLVGSLIGGIRETQEMLDYCARHKVFADVEVIAMDQINTAYERMLKGDVRYRFVIDMKTMAH